MEGSCVLVHHESIMNHPASLHRLLPASLHGAYPRCVALHLLYPATHMMGFRLALHSRSALERIT